MTSDLPDCLFFHGESLNSADSVRMSPNRPRYAESDLRITRIMPNKTRSVIRKMETVTLPRTDLKVSRICLGCWQMNDNKANASWEAQPYEVIHLHVIFCYCIYVSLFPLMRYSIKVPRVLSER